MPLFIKRPGQEKGTVNREIVETTDVLPTIADVLNIELAGEGRRQVGVLGRGPEPRRGQDAQARPVGLDQDARVRVRAAQDAEDRERVAKFGEGKDGPDRIYRIGPNQELIGQKAQSAGASQSKVTLTAPRRLRQRRPARRSVPTWVTGRVSRRPAADIAIAVNGTVRAVGNTFKLATGGGELIGVMVPENSFKKGRNTVEVFQVENGRLLKMGGS